MKGKMKSISRFNTPSQQFGAISLLQIPKQLNVFSHRKADQAWRCMNRPLGVTHRERTSSCSRGAAGLARRQAGRSAAGIQSCQLDMSNIPKMFCCSPQPFVRRLDVYSTCWASCDTPTSIWRRGLVLRISQLLPTKTSRNFSVLTADMMETPQWSLSSATVSPF